MMMVGEVVVVVVVVMVITMIIIAITLVYVSYLDLGIRISSGLFPKGKESHSG